MATSACFPSKLRLPGHSRASTGGMAMSGVGLDSNRSRRISSAVRMQSESGSGAVEVEKPSLSEATPTSAGRVEHPPTSPTSPVAGGHIRVAVRVRPLPQSELGIIEVAGNNDVLIQKDAASGGNGYLSSQQGRIETRSFDRVFGPQSTQEEVYEYSCAPLVREAVAAARCATVFAYGATGAGKTHTMFGADEAEQHGIVLRAIPAIFKAVAEHNEEVDSSDYTLHVKASFLEIYNETVRDLLQDGGGMCRVLEDERRGVVQVSNLVEAPVACAEDALAYLDSGMEARTVEATAANSQSSRAHAVFSLTIERVLPPPAQDNLRSRLARGTHGQRQLHTKISFIDLAGSERAAFTQNVGQALKDGARINQSLLALANCIDALIVQSRLAPTSTPRKKPPYRDSKLTLMLKGSLMGDGLVAMIANVHPGRLHFEDSNNTLEYAKRASTVKASNRRLSRQSFGFRRSQSGDLDDASIAPTLSSSSLPKPRRTREAQESARLSRKDQSSIPYCEITTASSPEECLSEISLSSGQDPEEDVESASSFAAPTGDAPEEEESDQKACAGAFDSLLPNTDVAAQQCEPAQEESSHPEKGVAARLLSKLQKDNQRMDARLREATRERNALLKDRQSLEDENERLRQEGIEKDRQLLLLLGRCDLLTSTPSVSVAL